MEAAGIRIEGKVDVGVAIKNKVTIRRKRSIGTTTTIQNLNNQTIRQIITAKPKVPSQTNHCASLFSEQ